MRAGWCESDSFLFFCFFDYYKNIRFLLLKPSLRVTVTLKDFGQRQIGGASILVDYKKCFHTSQTGPLFCGFYSHFTGECNYSSAIFRSIGPDSSLLKNRGLFLTDKNA